jgi:ribosomal-protein-alanine N-acetyltransferase
MIRKFNRADLEEIMDIEKNAFPKLPYSRFTFLYYVGMNPDNFWVYVEKSVNKVVGYIIFYPDGHIVSIAVGPMYRRKGIGTKLVEEVLKESNGDAMVEVRESNSVAQQFYKKLGFVLQAIIPHYYGNEDALVMIRYIRGSKRNETGGKIQGIEE